MTEEDNSDKKKVLDNHHEYNCLEEEVLGNSTVRLRNIMGILAVITTCIISLGNAFTTHYSVTNGHGWPSDLTMIATNIGVVVIGWTFMRSNVIINSLLQVESNTTVLRRKAADMIRPSTDAPEGHHRGGR